MLQAIIVMGGGRGVVEQHRERRQRWSSAGAGRGLGTEAMEQRGGQGGARDTWARRGLWEEGKANVAVCMQCFFGGAVRVCVCVRVCVRVRVYVHTQPLMPALVWASLTRPHLRHAHGGRWSYRTRIAHTTVVIQRFRTCKETLVITKAFISLRYQCDGMSNLSLL